MKHKTQLKQILNAMTVLSPTIKGLHCGVIASECRVSRRQIENIIHKLVKDGKVKIIGQGVNFLNNDCNLYMLVNPNEIKTSQTKLF